MKFLQEVLRSVRRLDQEEQPQEAEMSLDGDPELTLDPEEDPGAVPDEMSLDEPSGDLESQEDGDPHPELDGIADEATSDPDRQGLIRTVKDAHLVYKRDTEDGTFEELWIYNLTTLRGELDVKKAILAGTDIPTNKTRSPDGSQTYEIWSSGNAEMILIKGLPN